MDSIHWRDWKLVQVRLLLEAAFFPTIINYCFFLINRVPLLAVFFGKARPNIKERSYELVSFVIVEVDYSCFVGFEEEVMLLD